MPKTPLVFDSEGRLLLFEVSKNMKKLPRLTIPTYFVSLTSAIVMMDSFASLSFLKGALFGMPFLGFLLMSTYMTQQSSVIVQKIELLREKSQVSADQEETNE